MEQPAVNTFYYTTARSVFQHLGNAHKSQKLPVCGLYDFMLRNAEYGPPSKRAGLVEIFIIVRIRY
jgi:hypothetical protein